MSNTPSFFKILHDPSAPHLELPFNFVRKHLKKEIPQHPTTLTLETGECSWHLKIKKIDENYYLAHGWNKVVQDTHLGYGDFLVFSLIDQSTFQLSIYGPSGCQKDFSSIFNKFLRKKIKIEEGEDLKNEYEHPCFQKVISFKTHKHIMRLPKKFVAEVGITRENSMVVKDLEGMEWPMSLQVEPLWGQRYYLSTGWSRFFYHNKLSNGDVCLFKFIKKEGTLNLTQVVRKKGLARNKSLRLQLDIENKTRKRLVKRKGERSSLKAMLKDIKREDDDGSGEKEQTNVVCKEI